MLTGRNGIKAWAMLYVAENVSEFFVIMVICLVLGISDSNFPQVGKYNRARGESTTTPSPLT